jgi:hypothetical protein
LLIRGEVAVREHHALREARRPAGVRKCGELVEVGAQRGRRTRLGYKVIEAGDVDARRIAGPRQQALFAELHADRLDDRPERLVDENRFGPGVLDLEAHLTLLRLRVDRVHDTAGSQRRVERGDELDRVRHEERHAVAATDAASSQRARETIACGVELRVSDHAIAVDQRGLHRNLACDLAKSILQRDAAVREGRRLLVVSVTLFLPKKRLRPGAA